VSRNPTYEAHGGAVLRLEFVKDEKKYVKGDSVASYGPGAFVSCGGIIRT